MAFELDNFQDDSLDNDYLTYLVDHQAHGVARNLCRCWDYFRNELFPMHGGWSANAGPVSRPYVQAQEAGLPARITGIFRADGAEQRTDLRRKEVVIENDIAWRVHTMIDFLFGKSPSIRSLAGDPSVAAAVESVISAVLQANGGISFLQELALFGSVYGFVDVALRTPAPEEAVLPPSSSAAAPASAMAADGPGSPSADNSALAVRSGFDLSRALAWARRITLETIEAPRVLPVLDENDYRQTRFWIQRFVKHPARLEGRRPWLGLWGRRSGPPSQVEVIEIVSALWWQRYENRRLVAEGPNMLGRLPIVHICNTPVPGTYEGLSDVEPLIPLQDELNTRLSDRANRVTYQSFKMYLGKGIDDFLERPVGPGQMWATQNLSATIQEFGSDTGSPSEDSHIDQVRAALDKVSGVSPVAAGLIRGNIGNLSSATALKVLLSGLLAKNDKKRISYGVGLQQIVDLVLDYLDRSGVLPTRPDDRRIEIHWPNPLPSDEAEQLRNAQIKAQLGVPAERILAELGYDRQFNKPTA